MSLTPKQQRFVEEYLVDLNATQAAIRAGYSAQTAAEQASRLLTNINVAGAVAEAQADRSERTQITADNVLKELALIGFEDMGDYAQWGPDGVTLLESSDVNTRPVAEVKETHSKYGTSVSFKLHDKVGALEKLGKHLGIFVDRSDVHHSGGVSVGLREVPDDALKKLLEEAT